MKIKNEIKKRVWRWTLLRLRSIVDAADEWIHAEEIKLRAPLDPPAPPAEVDRQASAAREKAHKRAARPRTPRLRYDHGAWVRQ